MSAIHLSSFPDIQITDSTSADAPADPAADTPVSPVPGIGYMSMPFHFPRRDTFLKGRPRHDALSDFARKHPRMDCARRAKLFMPFDALKGFDEAIESETRKAASLEASGIHRWLHQAEIVTPPNENEETIFEHSAQSCAGAGADTGDEFNGAGRTR